MEVSSCNRAGLSSSKLSVHKDSHIISKFKPKIRIIHIFAPEIIKTDVANFRELVQTLTGKPAADVHKKGEKMSKSKHQVSKNIVSTIQEPSKVSAPPNFLIGRENVKEEVNDRSPWDQGGESSSIHGLFDEFIDLDDFIQELRDGFPSSSTKEASHSEAYKL